MGKGLARTIEYGRVANRQDFTISVAAIHHLSTPARRRQAVQVSLSLHLKTHQPTPTPLQYPSPTPLLCRLESKQRGKELI